MREPVTDDQQIMLEAACAALIDNGEWPKYGYVAKQVRRSGGDPSAAHRALPPHLLRPVQGGGTHAPDDTFALTVPGLAYCEDARPMLATFIEVVRYLVRAEADGDVSANGLQRVEVTSHAVRSACNLDEADVALMCLLFETESWVLEGTLIQSGSHEWTAQLPDLSSWHDVDTIDLYVERRAARANRRWSKAWARR